jgi:chaperonin GroES
MPRRSLPAASSSPTPPRRSPPKARSSRWAPAAIDLKVGDRVLFGKWSGTEVKIDGQELLIMKESDIMGVLDEQVSRRKAA